MNKIFNSFFIVFSKPVYIITGIIATFAIAVLYAFAGNVFTSVPGGVFWDFDPVKTIPLGILSILFGIVVSLNVYAFKNSSVTFKQGFSGFFSSFFGLTAFSCCASLLPALLSLLGFTGSNLILLNVFFRRYVVLFTIITGAMLIFSMKLVSKNICADKCEVRR